MLHVIRFILLFQLGLIVLLICSYEITPVPQGFVASDVLPHESGYRERPFLYERQEEEDKEGMKDGGEERAEEEQI
jgi:hypothetical protein